MFDTIEREALRPLPPSRFELVVWKKAKVHQDSHIAFERRLYSVPWKLVGKHVWVRATDSTVAAYFEEERVATHSRRGSDKRSTIEEHLPEHRRPWRHRSREHWEKVADALGPEAGELIRDIFDADDVLYQLRTVQGIVKYLQGYPPHRVAAACRRASFHGVVSYSGVKRILVEGLDLEPLPTAVAPVGRLAAPRYARNIEDLFVAAVVAELVPLLKKLRLSGTLQSLELRTNQAVDDDLSHVEFLYRLMAKMALNSSEAPHSK